MNLQTLDKFHKTRRGYAVFGLVELAMCYGFVDWALDTGNLLWWTAALVLLVGGLQDVLHVIWRPKK
jgi:hypothetical protein